MDTIETPNSDQAPSPEVAADRSAIIMVSDNGGEPFAIYPFDPASPGYADRHRTFQTTRAGFAVETVGAPLDPADLAADQQ